MVALDKGIMIHLRRAAAVMVVIRITFAQTSVPSLHTKSLYHHMTL